MHLGFIGTGHIASALVEGFAQTGGDDERYLLSPRGAEHGRRLAREIPRVTVMEGNQQVVNESDIVFLCVRPSDAEAVLHELRFESRHLLISLIAVLPLSRVQALAPATTVVRAVPIPAARRRLSPTGVFPAHPRAEELFNRIGAALTLQSERELSVLWSATGLISPIYALLAEISGWLESEGLSTETASRFTLMQTRGMLELASDSPPSALSHLATAAATPGGLNEQALGQLRQAGVYQQLRLALDGILQRLLRGLSTPSPQSQPTPNQDH